MSPKENSPYLIIFLGDCPEGRTQGEKNVLSEVLCWLAFAVLDIIIKHSALKQQTLFLMILWVGWVFSSGLAGRELRSWEQPPAHCGGPAKMAGVASETKSSSHMSSHCLAGFTWACSHGVGFQ